jgi:adenine-specific DNA-methyltransferase
MIDFNQPYQRENFLQFLEVSFLPDDFKLKTETVAIPFQTKYFKSVTLLGETDRLGLAVYEVRHSSENDARVGLTREMFRLMAAYGKRRSLVILVPETGNTYRFSLVTIDLKFEDDKVKRTFSNPKRYSFILGENAKLHTPQKFLITQGKVSNFEDLQKRFSVEVVNKEFYNTLFNWFQWACQEVKYPTGKNEEELIRFISRMMFVWFLKQMKLVPEELFEKEKITSFLIDLSENESTYYKAILQNLFFATLNTSMRKDLVGNQAHVREFLPYGIITNKRGLQYYYRYSKMMKDPELFQKTVDGVPFLNGGLFECLDERENETGNEDKWIDVFTQNTNYQHLLIFPNKLFFEPEKGLLDIFDRYNFTVEESSPIDMNVGLDPEMLGSVFENLLAAYNPETRDNARRETASFYTPKQVVDFMTTETLKEYLNEKVLGIDRSKLDQLFDYTFDENPFNQLITQKIVAALGNIKILDPACGSGAFPMGILNSIVHALHKIDSDNELWKNQQIDKILKDQPDYSQRKAEIERIFNQSNSETNFARKLFLIENAINGVDIQPIAIQISKLRFFLSLVIEQEIDPEKKNLGIIPLPNLETRFVCTDTLLKLKKPSKLNVKIRKANKTLFGEVIPQQMNMFTDTQELPHVKIEKELKDVRHRYFEAKTIETKRKYRDLDCDLRVKLASELEELGYPGNESRKIAEWNPYDKSKVTDWFEPEFMLGVENGFDIVIGNPPYIQLQNDGGKLAERYKPENYDTFARTGDIYCLFYERASQLLNPGGHLCLITSNKWMRAGYGEKLRGYLSGKSEPITLLELGPNVFEAATVDTNILLSKNRNTAKHNLKACILNVNFKRLDVGIATYFDANSTTIENLSGEKWIIQSGQKQGIETKIRMFGKPLKDWDLKINFGIKTGYNPAFIIDGIKRQQLIAADPQNAEIIKPLLRGRDTQKFLAGFNDNWLINTHNGYCNSSGFKLTPINISDFSKIKIHLENHWESILSRSDQGVTPFNLRNCAYLEDFEKEKIVWKRIGSIMRFSYDDTKAYCLDSTCIATGEKIKYLVGLLNSKLCLYELAQLSPKTGTGDMIISVQALEPLCVYYPNEEIEEIITRKVNEILNLKHSGENTQTLENQIDLVVFKQYELTYDEAMIVNPELGKLIGREEYEKAGMEELAEWKMSEL